jgi:hypothetical protein
MLSVCPAFFSGSNGKKRLCGGEVVDPTEEPAYKLFVNDRLILQANELLTVESAYAHFNEYCVSLGLVAVERKHFRSLIAEVIKEEYEVSYRKDLKNEQGKWVPGRAHTVSRSCFPCAPSTRVPP